MQDSSTSRSKEVEDENSMAIMRAAGEELINKFHASQSAPLRPVPNDIPSVPDVTQADQPMSSRPTDFMLHTINREVTAQATEKSWKDQMAADDLMAAVTAAAEKSGKANTEEKNTKANSNLEKVRL